jgi:hypothetical protein
LSRRFAATESWAREDVRLLTGGEEPGRSDLGALRQRESIVYVDAKIANGVLDFGMAEQYLHSAQIAGGLVNDRRFRVPNGMSSILLTTQADAADPLIDQPRVLPGAKVISVVDTAREDIVSQCAAPSFEQGKQARSCVCQQLELNRTTCFLLNDDGAGAYLPSDDKVTNLDPDHVAAPQLAIDS